MLELVFVIMIIGIIAALVIPRIDRDNVFEAANQVVNHIKYTQHLAMTEDVYNDQVQDWHRGRWQIQFYGCGGYAVSKDLGLDGGLPGRLESARDPQTRKFLYTDAACTVPAQITDYERVNLAGAFDIANIALSVTCGGLTIAFDTLGRPYSTLAAGAPNGVLKQPCNILITSNTGTARTVQIQPETGYACILDAAGVNCI